jgi:hypothetical protein
MRIDAADVVEADEDAAVPIKKVENRIRKRHHNLS